MVPAGCQHHGGRLRAVFFCTALSMMASGCTSLGNSPLGASLESVFFADNPIAEQANAVPYASLSFDAGGQPGLVVMASRVGDTSYWQLRDSSTVVLQHNYLERTAGFNSDLIDTTLNINTHDAAAPWALPLQHARYSLTRQWRTSHGELLQHSADVTLKCEAEIEEVSLPLTTLPLQRCTETLAWDTGDTTQSELWRSPETYRLWAVTTQPWPDAPIFSWQVARPEAGMLNDS